LGRNAASALAMKNLINMAGRHMIHDVSETERRRLGQLLDSLTKQQKRCACWAFGGMTNKEIGQEIGRTTRTVKSHLSKVYACLGLQHRSPFVKRAIMVKMMFDTSRHQEAGAEMRQLFSPRQIDVLDLVSEGLKNKEIARCLSMSEHIIKNDLRRIFDLAGCDSRVEVVVWWRNHRGCREGRVNSEVRDGQSIAPLLCTPNLCSSQASNQLRT
jgi:DNA-binding CsgD family transcriptional regulator